MTNDCPNILKKIINQKQKEIEVLKKQGMDAFESNLNIKERRDFKKALSNNTLNNIALIAELKKASPSAGIICYNFEPAQIATAYANSGAACLSVLTDREFFQGSTRYLQIARQTVNLPVLRKDFIIDKLQIIESAAIGADAILLIVAALEEKKLVQLIEFSKSLNLTTLVEVHNETEAAIAIDTGADLIGVNNRDLKTFTIDINITERVIDFIHKLKKTPPDLLIVSESGIYTNEDVRRVKRAGANAVLIGESLMRNPLNIPQKIAELFAAD